MQWYYVKGGKRQGPVDQSQLADLLARKILEPSDWVWHEGLGSQWVTASSVPGLCGAAQPPLPPPGSVLPPMPPPIEPALAAAHGVAPSCIDPVGVAWTRTGALLFKPFSMAKWFALGVSAWLATLGQGGSQGLGPMNYDAGDMGKLLDAAANDPGARAGGGGGAGELIQKAGSFLATHMGWIVLAGGLVVILVVALGLAMLWVRCRGKFVFLDNLVQGRTDVKNPWRRFTRSGNSLFLWSFGYGLVLAVLLIGIALAAVVGVVVPCVRAGTFVVGVMGPLILAILLFVLVLVVNAYVMRFLEDFVVPIMYRLDLTASEAWRRFLPLLRFHFWRFVLYGVFYAVLGLGAGTLVLVAVILTCCVAGCLMIIPYVGAVVVLPVTVFFRLYSLEYLAQYGTEYRLLEEAQVKG